MAGRAFVHAKSRRTLLTILELVGGLALLQTISSDLYSTRRGKFTVWAELLDSQLWLGNEHVLDMGCGRGAILAMVAKLVPRRRAVGLDLWGSEEDQRTSPATSHRQLGEIST